MSPESKKRAAMTMADRITELKKKNQAILLGGGKERIDKQHQSGKMTARERIDAFLDAGSFQEMYGFAQHRCTYFGMAGKDVPADGVVTGCGSVEGRLVHVASQDFTTIGGAVGETHADKIVEMAKASLKTGSPLVVIN
ncbi:MAG: methylmalonyl-CoA carboxyltransferase, partial [Phycisphaeraceae bacterium]|nr:methylmalonyl-CoA carboxyltransferase [Phycisphaeraceae bacterium]